MDFFTFKAGKNKYTIRLSDIDTGYGDDNAKTPTYRFQAVLAGARTTIRIDYEAHQLKKNDRNKKWKNQYDEPSLDIRSNRYNSTNKFWTALKDAETDNSLSRKQFFENLDLIITSCRKRMWVIKLDELTLKKEIQQVVGTVTTEGKFPTPNEDFSGLSITPVYHHELCSTYKIKSVKEGKYLYFLAGKQADAEAFIPLKESFFKMEDSPLPYLFAEGGISEAPETLIKRNFGCPINIKDFNAGETDGWVKNPAELKIPFLIEADDFIKAALAEVSKIEEKLADKTRVLIPLTPIRIEDSKEEE